ncbi:MAG: ABC transporter permease [Syntrophobacteraceae bacterium]
MFEFLCLVLGKATPLFLAGLGGLLSESSGVVNFALEGMMLLGAFAAVWATGATGSPWWGLLGAVVAGVLTGVVHATACLKWRVNQIISSICLNLLAAGLTGMLLNEVYGVYGTSPSVEHLPEVSGGVSALTPLAILVAAGVTALYRWSAWGLHIRACGENPLAAASAGIEVFRTRLVAIAVGGGIAGAAGAFLSIGVLSQFVEKMTQGRGYLAVAALILGRWKPSGVLAAALFFGFLDALSEWMAVRWMDLPQQLFLAFPYLACLAVLAFRFGAMHPPSALGRVE